MKESLGTNDLLLHVDFSESYKNQQQNEIQTAYFGSKCFSIFTACAYYRSTADDDRIESLCVTVVTESSEHNRACALTCIKKVVMEVERLTGPHYNSIDIWTDGCSAQFRSRYVFFLAAKSLLKSKKLAWNYNERHHGKGPMEGVGGTLKRSVFNAVKSGKIVVNNSEVFAIAANDILNGIHIIFMHDDEIMTEPEGVDEATYIHKGYPSNSSIRSSREQKRSAIIKFYELSNDETPFFTR